MGELIKTFSIATLYCSKKALVEIGEMGNYLGKSDLESINELANQSGKAIAIFRKDLQECRKYKFQ